MASMISYSIFLFALLASATCIANNSRAHRLQNKNGTETVAEVNVTVNRNTSCQDGWIAYNGSCFMIGRTTETWSTADLNCKSFGASLWVVASIDEWNVIRPYANPIGWNWIGVSWQVGSSGPTWVSTSQSSFSPELLPWLIPSGSHGYTSASQCVAYYHDPKGVSYVNYNPCSYKYYFICKSTAVAAATTTQSPKTTAAPTTSTTPSP